MATTRIFTICLMLLASCGAAAAQGGAELVHQGNGFLVATPPELRTAQQNGQEVIAPSMALRLALRYSPDSQGLDVTLVQGGRLVYAVKLKTGNRVHRVLVDARTGQIVGE